MFFKPNEWFVGTDKNVTALGQGVFGAAMALCVGVVILGDFADSLDAAEDHRPNAERHRRAEQSLAKRGDVFVRADEPIVGLEKYFANDGGELVRLH